MFTQSFSIAPIDHSDPDEHRRLIAEEVFNLGEGKIRSVGSVTLTINVATTTLTDRRIGPSSFVGFMPTTSNAAAGVTALYVTGRGDGTCTLNHANNAQADRTYVYVVLG